MLYKSMFFMSHVIKKKKKDKSNEKKMHTNGLKDIKRLRVY